MSLDWWAAVIAAAVSGKTEPLARLLEAGHPANDEERKFLAKWLRDELKRSRGDQDVRRAAAVLNQVKAAFRRGVVPIHGHRFHEGAIQCTFDYLQSRGEPLPDRQKLENFIRRARRKSRT